MDRERLLDVERGFWKQGEEYYRRHLDDISVFVFPGMVLGKEDAIQEIIQAPRWADLKLSDPQFMELSDNIILLTYRAEAVREGEDEPFKANVTSIYRFNDTATRLMFHQHTPEPE